MNLSEFRLHSNISWSRSGTIKQLPPSDKHATPTDVKLAVSQACGIGVHEIDMKNRNRNVVIARMILAMYLLKYHRFGLVKIGRLCGGKDHATILHYKKQFFILLDCGDEILKDYLRKFNEELLKIDTNFKTL